ncbi:hypothetical protein HJFPF1_01759 [Paramyrothecium foliicola]|nr:hypothetical protein HJFPF1_01759 [Paramyrothecium foliicola]
MGLKAVECRRRDGNVTTVPISDLIAESGGPFAAVRVAQVAAPTAPSDSPKANAVSAATPCRY